MTGDFEKLSATFEDSLWLRGRLRVVSGGHNSAGTFVLYWMHNAVRAHENPALDAARLTAEELGLPLLVYHAISERYPFASDRLHTFMLEGARDVQREFAEKRIHYVFHLERDGHRGPYLKQLADRAAVVITEDVPVKPLTDWLARLVESTSTPIWAVDSSCVVPMPLMGKAYTRAFEFRNATASLYQERLGLEPSQMGCPDHQSGSPGAEVSAFTADQTNEMLGNLPFETLDLQTADLAELIGHCHIDHSVGPVPHTRGGSVQGYERWDRFKKHNLRAYARLRNNALTDGVSRMSAYLHFGMVSPFRIARETLQTGGAGAEKYLDELIVWRELAWAFCFYRPDHDTLSAIPEWARETLEDHQSDKRPALHDWETLARGETGDALWDAAQKSLLMHGELHNNVRMTWGKAILNWTPNAESALTMMIDLNHRYALDGRDPASYGGLLWCLGQFDRPFRPARAILGNVRPRPTHEHAKRLSPAKYLQKTTRPLLHSMPSVAVIGAGISGLTAARTLADHGFDVTLFDKGRGVGGRMSTRRTNTGFSFDHGAQYFATKDERFRRYVDAWNEIGVVDRWAGRIVELTNGKIRERRPSDRFVGIPGMNAVCRHLARGLTVRCGTPIQSVEHGERWRLISAAADEGEFDYVVSAIPPAQAQLLFKQCSSLMANIAAMPFAPCWASMFAFPEPLEFPADGALTGNSSIAWMARNSSKPAREASADCWVVHATAEWTHEHLEAESDSVASLMLRELFRITGAQEQQPLHVNAHRWRYSIPTEPVSEGCLTDFDRQLLVCGDWCLGNRVEAAFLSGVAAAGALMRSAFQDEPSAAIQSQSEVHPAHAQECARYE